MSEKSTHGHLSTFAIVLDVNMLIVSPPAPGVTSVTETTRLVDFTVAAKRFVVIRANLSPGVDFFVADLHANAFGRVFVDSLELLRHI